MFRLQRSSSSFGSSTMAAGTTSCHCALTCPADLCLPTFFACFHQDATCRHLLCTLKITWSFWNACRWNQYYTCFTTSCPHRPNCCTKVLSCVGTCGSDLVGCSESTTVEAKAGKRMQKCIQHQNACSPLLQFADDSPCYAQSIKTSVLFFFKVPMPHAPFAM